MRVFPKLLSWRRRQRILWGDTGVTAVTAVTGISAPGSPVIPVTAVTDDMEQTAVPRTATADVDTCFLKLPAEAHQFF